MKLDTSKSECVCQPRAKVATANLLMTRRLDILTLLGAVLVGKMDTTMAIKTTKPRYTINTITYCNYGSYSMELRGRPTGPLGPTSECQPLRSGARPPFLRCTCHNDVSPSIFQCVHILCRYRNMNM